MTPSAGSLVMSFRPFNSISTEWKEERTFWALSREYVRLSHEVVELRRSGNQSLAQQWAQDRDRAIKSQWGVDTTTPVDARNRLLGSRFSRSIQVKPAN